MRVLPTAKAGPVPTVVDSRLTPTTRRTGFARSGVGSAATGSGGTSTGAIGGGAIAAGTSLGNGGGSIAGGGSTTDGGATTGGAGGSRMSMTTACSYGACGGLGGPNRASAAIPRWSARAAAPNKVAIPIDASSSSASEISLAAAWVTAAAFARERCAAR